MGYLTNCNFGLTRLVGREKIVIGGGNRNSKIIVAPAILKQLSNVEIIEDLAVPI